MKYHVRLRNICHMWSSAEMPKITTKMAAAGSDGS